MSEHGTTIQDATVLDDQIAEQRSRLAGKRYDRDTLRAHAQDHGVRVASLNKYDLGWHLAQHGLIDADGVLRDRASTQAAA